MPSPRRQPFRFTRPLTEAPGSLAPHTLHDFTRGAARLLLPSVANLRPDAHNLLTPTTNLELTIVPARIVRIARSHATAHREISMDGLKGEIYDRLPAAKAGPVIAGILGAAVVGRGNVLTLELESETLAAERAAAAEAVRDIFRVPEDIDLTLPVDLDLPLGSFPGGVDDEIVDALADVTLPLAERGTLAFGAIPDPHELAAPAV